MARDFEDFPNGVTQLTANMKSGLFSPIWEEDTAAVMEKLLKERAKPPAMREGPFRKAAFLNCVKDLQDNPWWILFGYIPELNTWQGNPSDYSLADHRIDGGSLERAIDRATDLHTTMLQIDTSTWIIGNKMRWTGLVAFVATITRRAIPGFAWIIWGQLRRKEFHAVDYTDQVSGLTATFAIPMLTTMNDWLEVANDGIAAIYRFMYAAGLAIPQVSLPSTHAFLLDVPESAKERNLQTLNMFLRSSNGSSLLPGLRSLGGVHDVFESSRLMDAGVFETVTGDDLCRLCAQNQDVFIEDLTGGEMAFFAQVAGLFFVGAHLEWDTTMGDSKLKLEKMDGRRESPTSDVFNCTVKENINWKSSRSVFSIFHGKQAGSASSQTGSSSAEEWFPDRAIILPRVEDVHCPLLVMIEWCARSDPKRRMHWVKCTEVPQQVRDVSGLPGRLTFHNGEWVNTGSLGQTRRQGQQACFFIGRSCINFRISEFRNFRIRKLYKV